MELVIKAGEARRHEGQSRTLAIEVMRGTLWLTFAGDQRDYILTVGEAANLRGRAAILQALGNEECAYQVQEGSAARLPGPRGLTKLTSLDEPSMLPS